MGFWAQTVRKNLNNENNCLCLPQDFSGSLQVFGMDPDTHPAEIKLRLGVVPQETNLDPDFTCFDNLLTYSRYFDIPPAMARKRAESAGICPVTGKKGCHYRETFRRNETQRLILPSALVNNPELLILDEPTIGLDPQARHLIWERLKMLQAQGNTIVLTTHYLEETARLATGS